MRRRTLGLGLIALLGVSTPLAAQRPLVGFGIGGGVILGTSLLNYGAALPGESEILREIDMNHVGILDAHVEIYPIPHFALRGHGMWGSGDLRIENIGASGSSVDSRSSGRVRISGLDAGLSFWPWSPNTAGFTPFVTIGFGRVTYDFDAADEGGFFEARGSRKENAFLFGVGADMNVWRALTLRFEAMNHRVPSPLDSRDFLPGIVSPSEFDRNISNVRLALDVHIYLPFGRNGAESN